MEIKIAFEGEYRDGDWVATSIVAHDLDGQKYEITRDTDGTYCVVSDLHGDDRPMFAGELDFATAWMGLATAFGVTVEPF